MAHNNCSFYDANKIIEGIETQDSIKYNRYKTPSRWPNLQQKSFAEITGQESNLNKRAQTSMRQNVTNNKIETNNNTGKIDYKKQKDRQDTNRKAIMDRRESIKQYYKQFDDKKSEVSKEKYGIALKKIQYCK